ncbi:MAG: flagellar hook-basal body protein [Lachnospiraceae bacterium]|nr:flagellar hook-basal body protein [Lachnospiraceae bacterium]
MVKGLYTAHSAMINEQHRMDTLTNNLANVSTTGYKKEGATSQTFADALAVKLKDSSEWYLSRRLGNMQPGVKIGENYTDWSQGSFRGTENTFDLALSDSGFFEIEFTDKAGNTSVKYTRDGSFTLTNEGVLVTKDGDFVLDTNGNHIQIDPLKETSIDRQGNITQGENNQVLATIGTTDFERNEEGTDYYYLEKYGENMWQTIDGATPIASNAQIYSGYLEQSNVETVQEMVNMISVQRQYEINQKIIQTMDSSLENAVNQLGKLR